MTLLAKERVFKGISILLFYTFILELAIPCSLALDQIKQGYRKPFQLVSTPVNTPSQENELNDLANEFESVAEPNVPTAPSASGPSQPESSGFSVNSNNGIMNEFTGDLSYSLPLLDIEGFPLTLSYDPNISMEQEASWVGLGWNLSMGSINREMRGLPDDFSGDKVKRTFKTLDNEREGNSKTLSITVSGIPVTENDYFNRIFSVNVKSEFGFGKYFDTYTGEGKTKNISYRFGISVLGQGGNIGIGYDIDNQNGIGVNKYLGFDLAASYKGYSGGYSGQYSWASNSRSGITTKNSLNSFSLGKKGVVSSFVLGAEMGGQRGSSQSFGVHTYVPYLLTNNIMMGTSMDRQFGVKVYVGISGRTGISFKNFQHIYKLASYDNSINAYGYYHLAKSTGDPVAVLDYNQSKENSVDDNSIHLPFSIPTNDLFHCNAIGLSTNYRANRYEVVNYGNAAKGTVGFTISQHKVNDVTASPTKVGFQNTTGPSMTSDMSVNSKLNASHFPFINQSKTEDEKEYYLRTIGETTPLDETLFDDYGAYNPWSIGLNYSGTGATLSGTFMNGTPLPTDNEHVKKPSSVIHYREYTNAELERLNIQKSSYPLTLCGRLDENMFSSNVESYQVDASKPNLIGGVETINESGTRYLFMTPVYNYESTEVVFSASGLKESDPTFFNNTGLIQYSLGDNSVLNNRGRAQMYDSKTVPTYAHSFLLNYMFSSDYVDLTGNGPSNDDFGNYYKINYTQVYGKEDPFLWRLPMTGKASAPTKEKNVRLAYLGENIEIDKWDDVASYSHGKKDLWYGHSIESKNFIAVFCLEDREDQFSVVDDNGLFNGELNEDKPGKYLKKILLYSKDQLKASKENMSSVQPLQIVEFEYDYSLCKAYIANKNTHQGSTGDFSGKLTLKKIYMYSGQSDEGKKTPIEFSYSSINPNFAFNSTDKWGTYKPNNSDYPNHRFPEALQDIEGVSSATIHQNANAWKLKKVFIPTGGTMEFDYESDSYSHVQNERAMKFAKIVGMSDTITLNDLGDDGNIANYAQLTSKGVRSSMRDASEKKDHYNIVYFKLEQDITSTNKSEANAEVIKKYFTNEDNTIPDRFLFKMRVALGRYDLKPSTNEPRYEYVLSEGSIDKAINDYSYIGVVGNQAPFKYGYVVLKVEKITENTSNYYVTELQKANWEYARKNVPCTIYGDVDLGATQATDYCDYSNSLDFAVLVGLDLNKRINKKKYGLFFDEEKSFIRLFEPDNVKFGGGARISKITFKDNWNVLSGEESATYVWKYDVQSTNDRASTSGVASYEPVSGGEENPLYSLMTYQVADNRGKLPSENRNHINPLTDIAYPASVVGYEKVRTYFDGFQTSTAKNIGFEESTYHTAKKHPVKTINSVNYGYPIKAVDDDEKEKGFFKKHLGFTEGYVVVTNDMHGKKDQDILYDSYDNEISRSKYNYSQNLNPLSYLKDDGSVLKAPIPKSIDVYVDSWKITKKTQNIGNSNMKSFGVILGGPIPLPYLFWLKDNFTAKVEKTITGITLSKIVHEMPVLESVQTTYLGSVNTAHNLLYDPVSGDVILSSLNDEFNDKLYSFSYPAHWKYNQFDLMSHSDGAYVKQFVGSGSSLTWTLSNEYTIHVGDELWIEQSISGVPLLTKAWVLKIDNGNTARLINASGTVLSGVNWLLSDTKVRIFRTGVKNVVSASMAQVTTKVNPLNSTATTFTFPNSQILESSAITFEENKNVACNTTGSINSSLGYLGGGPTNAYALNQVVNPFLKGLKGNLRLATSYAYQTNRVQDPASTLNNTVRKEGYYDSYTPFYAFNGGVWKTVFEINGNYSNWRQAGRVGFYAENGELLQTEDPLKIKSAALTGMNRFLRPAQSAVVANAGIQDFGYDGFEIYTFNDENMYVSPTPHFSLYQAIVNAGLNPLTKETRHSGKYSLKLNGNSTYAEFNVRGADPVIEENIVSNQYQIKNCNCIRNFEPKVGEKYLISAWVKQPDPSINDGKITVSFYNSAGSSSGLPVFIVIPTEEVMDGWQKIEGTITIPTGAAKIRLSFQATEGQTVFFDDFRIHPLKAAMSSTVYDEITLLPTAEHDGSNYTIFYQYDENHQLVRIRVETINGIQTVSESETGIRKTN